ncbi:DEKNAAC102155 [Brettanomyces naardenensis]|uniref:Lon protease homolog, mitochondrial n=1 Tax=Brettanomyces naardenensis TaxID=13370 RepID=A0A448YK26_BRENA|nr:DEKNAAC102155 [Brettanomyces naardenensis]
MKRNSGSENHSKKDSDDKGKTHDKSESKDEEGEKDETTEKDKETPAKPEDTQSKTESKSSSRKAKASANGSDTAAGGAGSGSSSGGSRPKPKAKPHNIVELPEVYPKIIALPISRRPLFPGFYKAVIISDINVIKAIKESLDRQYPFIGCFLFKDESMESDVIESKDQVYETGVLAQITSNVYTKDSETGVETLTTVLYPHKRIRIDELYPPSANASSEAEVSDLETPVDEGSAGETEIIEGITGEKEGDEPKKPVEPSEIISAAEKEDVSDSLISPAEEEDNPTAFLEKYPITLVNVSNVEDEKYEKNDPVINSLTAAILEVLKEMSSLNKSFSDQLATFSASLHSDIFNCPEKLADFAAAVTAGEQNDLQEILECQDVAKRLEKALTVLKKELMNKEMQKKIEKDIEERMTKRHREYHLNEQLKWIKKELGIDDGREKLIAKLNERAKKLNMPPDVKKVYDDEINKLQTLEPMMSEFTVTRNYLDWITQIPWGVQSKDNYSIERARKILNDDHYGLQDVKDRILEFIAVGKLLDKINGKIICFVGPPGVGKTSIGKSIAKALNRKFYRFSVGGLSDVAEIKGHRRTYVGAIPGRVVQALKKTKTENPLILIDEIDKMSRTHSVNGGDPSAALLELLDPEQNNAFLDNYMDVPIDLSKVLFVCTANTLNTIPLPLLDRMEVIEISGYIEDEKIKIAEKYLAPEAKKHAGLEHVHVDITEEALKTLIKSYCRESGVRNLKKQIEKIYRKAALNVVETVGDPEGAEAEEAIEASEEREIEKREAKEKAAKEADSGSEEVNASLGEEADSKLEAATSATPEGVVPEKKTPTEDKEVKNKVARIVVPDDYKVDVTPENLKDYVGPPIFISDRLYQTTPPGVVMGLAWTSMGGSSLYIESVLEHALTRDSHPKVERTGQLGDVMKESVSIAYSFAKGFMASRFPENKFFDKAQIHLHCPEGATPKDGPSAGVTITSSFLSLALNRPLRPDVAMTGEITLTGKVLRIGGLKEKTLAAKRSGVKTIIFPKDNEVDWKELSDNVREGLDHVSVDWYSDAFKVLFPDITEEEGNKVWKKEFDKLKEEEETERQRMREYRSL